jgi:outer membrane protein OmpA-like peptidoglycan-associated protein
MRTFLPFGLHLRIVSIPLMMISAVTAQQPADSPAPPARRNLLSWAEGAFAIRAPSPARSEAAKVALDGRLQTTPIGIPRQAPLPHEILVELPALTTFESFGVPEIGEFGAMKGKHVKTVEIEASAEGPGAGFSPLVRFEVEAGKKAAQQWPVSKPRPSRWLKIRFLDRLTPQANDTDSVYFSELIGYGTREPLKPAPGAFTGIWKLRRGWENSPNLIELHQHGNQITGCQVVGGQTGIISGAVDEGLARLVTTTTQGGRKVSTPSLALVTGNRELHGVSSLPAGLSPFSGTPAQAGTTTPCSQAPEPPNPVSAALEAGLTAILYGIHFDVDSDVLRSDARPALEQIFAALEKHAAISVIVEGHTDSDGGDAHNLDLSRRRAQSVVAWLTERKIAPARLTPRGKGESEPIANNDSCVGRALNRRVEVEPVK